MTTRPRFSSRRHLAFISATESMGLSSMRISTRFKTGGGSGDLSPVRLPQGAGFQAVVFHAGLRAQRRMASCSRDISRENTATVFWVDFGHV